MRRSLWGVLPDSKLMRGGLYLNLRINTKKGMRSMRGGGGVINECCDRQIIGHVVCGKGGVHVRMKKTRGVRLILQLASQLFLISQRASYTIAYFNCWKGYCEAVQEGLFSVRLKKCYG